MIFEYQLIYGKRRTVSLAIKGDGRLVVRAPKKLGKKEIDAILRQKQEWIKKHLTKMDAKKAEKHEFGENEHFWYLGKKYPLRISDGYRSKLMFEDSAFYLSRFKVSQGKKLFITWYAQRAAEIIFQKAKHYADLMDVKYRRISVTSAQSRWGSCSSGQTINFTWRLVLAPPEIIDSVVVHELAHLIHHNHSKTFWSKVREFYPNYDQSKKWLKQNGHLLQI
jgi:predicted metal-dependent hydrolase